MSPARGLGELRMEWGGAKPVSEGITLSHGPPVGLLPGLPLTSHPNHLGLTSLTLSPKHLTRTVPLMFSFPLRSIHINPKEKLNIFISLTSGSTSYLLLSPTTFQAEPRRWFPPPPSRPRLSSSWTLLSRDTPGPLLRPSGKGDFELLKPPTLLTFPYIPSPVY